MTSLSVAHFGPTIATIPRRRAAGSNPEITGTTPPGAVGCNELEGSPITSRRARATTIPRRNSRNLVERIQVREMPDAGISFAWAIPTST
jgi:hypothetical protein